VRPRRRSERSNATPPGPTGDELCVPHAATTFPYERDDHSQKGINRNGE
jgi:hypothetical protein